MSICQLGMHKSVQDHTNANVCKQTYDASCNSDLAGARHTVERLQYKRHGNIRYATTAIPHKTTLVYMMQYCAILLYARDSLYPACTHKQR